MKAGGQHGKRDACRRKLLRVLGRADLERLAGAALGTRTELVEHVVAHWSAAVTEAIVQELLFACGFNKGGPNAAP